MLRELAIADLPAIQELSDSMDMRNDPKIGDRAEALIRDSKCTLYGAFKGEVLVGVGGLRDKANLAWIENIRVHGEYQRIGVGTELFRHGEELAREQAYQRVGFQTVTENAGTCRMGEILEYQRKHEMVAFYATPKNLPHRDDERSEQVPISTEEALEALERIPNGPRNEICIGWSYTPISADYFDSEPDMRFYSQDDAVMLELDDRNYVTKEIVVVNAMLYGSKTGVERLLSGFIARNANRGLPLIFLCPEDLIPDPLPEGFQYATVWTGGRNIVVLFTKDL
jgi:GNAT superfamily N-acetyltransferase